MLKISFAPDAVTMNGVTYPVEYSITPSGRLFAFINGKNTLIAQDAPYYAQALAAANAAKNATKPAETTPAAAPAAKPEVKPEVKLEVKKEEVSMPTNTTPAAVAEIPAQVAEKPAVEVLTTPAAPVEETPDLTNWSFAPDHLTVLGQKFPAKYNLAKDAIWIFTAILGIPTRLHVTPDVPRYNEVLEAATAPNMQPKPAETPAAQVETPKPAPKPAEKPAAQVETPKPTPKPEPPKAAKPEPKPETPVKPAAAAPAAKTEVKPEPKPEVKKEESKMSNITPISAAAAKLAATIDVAALTDTITNQVIAAVMAQIKGGAAPAAAAPAAAATAKPAPAKPAAEKPAAPTVTAAEIPTEPMIGRHYRIDFDRNDGRIKVTITTNNAQAKAVTTEHKFYWCNGGTYNKRLTVKAYRAALELAAELDKIA